MRKGAFAGVWHNIGSICGMTSQPSTEGETMKTGDRVWFNALTKAGIRRKRGTLLVSPGTLLQVRCGGRVYWVNPSDVSGPVFMLGVDI